MEVQLGKQLVFRQPSHSFQLTIFINFSAIYRARSFKEMYDTLVFYTHYKAPLPP